MVYLQVSMMYLVDFLYQSLHIYIESVIKI